MFSFESLPAIATKISSRILLSSLRKPATAIAVGLQLLLPMSSGRTLPPPPTIFNSFQVSGPIIPSLTTVPKMTKAQVVVNNIIPVSAVFVPGYEYPVPKAPTPLRSYDADFGSGVGYHPEKEKGMTRDVDECGCSKKKQPLPVEGFDPQPSPTNDDSASFSFPPLKIVGPVGLVASVAAIYFCWLFTCGRNKEGPSTSSTNSQPISSIELVTIVNVDG